MKTNQLLSKTILRTFSTIRHIIDVSHKLSSNLTWIYSNLFLIFHRVDWDLMVFVSLFYHKFVIRMFILPFLSLVMETNSFTRLKLHTSISDLKLTKMVSYLNLLPLYRSSPGVDTLILLYVTVTEVPVIFTDADA